MKPLQSVILGALLIITGLVIAVYSLSHQISVLSTQGLFAAICIFYGSPMFFKNLAQYLENRNKETR
ncbi:hypothetical protein ACMGE7_08405 [Macrococcus equi]|uniref:hypothetical protein n=1 Tax=Macrococcus equi TaxID=3395462 RepID=UPI0039BEA6A2